MLPFATNPVIPASMPGWTEWLVLFSPVLVSFLALGGVIYNSSRTRGAMLAAERERDRNALAASLRMERKKVQIDALLEVASVVRSLRSFNESMYGNPGEGPRDEESASALQAWAEHIKDIGTLSNASLAVRVLGSGLVADRIDAIRDRMWEYMESIGPPKFIAKHAQEAEQALEALVVKLVAAIREDLGVDAHIPERLVPPETV